MLKKLTISCLILLIAFLGIFTNTSKASFTELTEEKLKDAFQTYLELMNYGDDSEKTSISVTKDRIEYKTDEDTYTIIYDLDDNPKFYISIPVKKGMSYDEYVEKNANLALPMLAYIAVAEIQGTEPEDAAAYIVSKVVEGAVANITENSTKYIVSTDDTVANIPSLGIKVIKDTEFGNYAMDYVKSLYENSHKFDDSKEFDTFTWTTELEDVTDTSANIISTFTINKDADFTKINGYSEKLEEDLKETFKSIADNSYVQQSAKVTPTPGAANTSKNTSKTSTQKTNTSTKNNNTKTTTTNNTKSTKTTTTTKSSKTTSTKKLPKTGKVINSLLIVLYSLVATCGVAIFIIISKKK